MTDKPFPQALAELLDERDWSGRELARRTQKETGWGTHATISFLLRGEMSPGPEPMEKIARALRISPEHFAEYRLVKARQALDPEQVGVEQALANLSQMTDGKGLVIESPSDPEVLLRQALKTLGER